MKNRKDLLKSIKNNSKRTFDLNAIENEDLIILQVLAGSVENEKLHKDDSLILSDKLFMISESMGLSDESDLIWDMADLVSGGLLNQHTCTHAAEYIGRQYVLTT